MPTYKDTIMIHDGRFERAVQVTIDAPAGVSINNLQMLAEAADGSPT